MLKKVLIPDIGTYSNVEIIEILVKEGDSIAKDASMITLETDKATMEIPSPFAGQVKNLLLKLGDRVSAGDEILTLEIQEEQRSDEIKPEVGHEAKPEVKSENIDTAMSSILKEVFVPDIGTYSNVEVIEILIKEGDRIAKDASIITLETEKATMEIPSPYSGTVKIVNVKLGDKVSAGHLILSLETMASGAEQGAAAGPSHQKDASSSKDPLRPIVPQSSSALDKNALTPTANALPKEKTETMVPRVLKAGEFPHAGPGVRRFARELGVDLRLVPGNGRKNRILQTDVQQYVKNELKRIQSGTGLGESLNLSPWPTIDHAQFGPISKQAISRIKKLSGSFLHRNWMMVPHVTQFDEADITELEKFRKESQALAEEGIKLTPLVFIMKAVTTALHAFPNFNASLDASGTELTLKKYFHIGVAVDTPNGLMVPIVRDVDQKGLFQLAKDLGEISQKARKGQLTAQDMQGSSFSISSLGGIGGTAFTPIINVPDVAILGVSKAQIKPVYQDNEFIPRLMLPLSLSYDHRVIDGAEAVRFTTFLVKQLSDIRRLLL